jgi:hypothetical protein
VVARVLGDFIGAIRHAQESKPNDSLMPIQVKHLSQYGMDDAFGLGRLSPVSHEPMLTVHEAAVTLRVSPDCRQSAHSVNL